MDKHSWNSQQMEKIANRARQLVRHYDEAIEAQSRVWSDYNALIQLAPPPTSSVSDSHLVARKKPPPATTETKTTTKNSTKISTKSAVTVTTHTSAYITRNSLSSTRPAIADTKPKVASSSSSKSRSRPAPIFSVEEIVLLAEFKQYADNRIANTAATQRTIAREISELGGCAIRPQAVSAMRLSQRCPKNRGQIDGVKAWIEREKRKNSAFEVQQQPSPFKNIFVINF